MQRSLTTRRANPTEGREIFEQPIDAARATEKRFDPGAVLALRALYKGLKVLKDKVDDANRKAVVDGLVKQAVMTLNPNHKFKEAGDQV